MITPDQIRNSAKFGSPLRAEVLLELAHRLEKLEAAHKEKNDSGHIENPPKEIDPNKWAFDRGLESY